MTDAAGQTAGAQGNGTQAANGAGAGQGTAAAGAQARSALLSGGDAEGTAPSGGAADQGTQNSAQGGADWRSGFSEGLDDGTKETWGKLSSRYTSPAEMAKAHVNLVQTMDKRIAIPDANAKPEEVDAVFQKLGMPEKAEDYKFNLDTIEHWDSGRKEQVKGLAPLFRKARATQAQVDEFVKQQAELDKVAEDANLARANTLAQQRMTQLKTEWRGEDFKRNQALVATTVRNYAGADTDEIASMRLADGTFAVDHPAFARMFAKIGAERAEDDRDPTAFNVGARESVKSQIEAIENEMIEKGITPSDRRYPNAKLEGLYAKLHGRRNDHH